MTPTERDAPQPSSWTLRELDEDRLSRQEPSAAETMSVREDEREAAYREGLAEGKRVGEAEAATLMTTALEAVRAAAAAVEAERSQVVGAAESNIAALATAIAAHLIEREVRERPDAVSDLVRAAVTAFPLEQPLTVRLNPEDLARITGVTRAESRAISGSRDVRWVPDPEVRVGGCMVEGPERLVDGRVDVALERIYRALVDG